MQQVLLIICLTVGSLCTCSAQQLDSIGYLLSVPPKPALKIDGRGSFIANRPVRMLGIKVGLSHGDRLLYGIGYNFLRTEVMSEGVLLIDNIENTVNARMRIGMFTPWLEYAFHQKGPWQVSIPVQLGIGAASLVYTDPSGAKHRFDKTFLVAYEPAMTVQYRFFRYFALSAGAGYRLLFKRKGSLGQQLTAPIYLVGVKVFFSDIARDVGLTIPGQ